MKKFDRVLVVSHVIYQKDLPRRPINGPYNAVCSALSKIVDGVDILGIPLDGYQNEVFFGEWEATKKFHIPSFLGRILPVKFIVDIFLGAVFVSCWSLKNWNKKKLVVGIDPLSCLPLSFFKKIFRYTLVFYCVDFNKNRFGNKLMQGLYEMADKFASLGSDRVWVICDAMKKYKKKHWGLSSFYLPNSVVFDPSLYTRGKGSRIGDKMVWTGSLMTNRQFDILFGVLSLIQTKIRTDIKFLIAPTRDFAKFKKYVNKYKLKKTRILKLEGRKEFQKIAAKCDVGIALYDEQFGSTEFIEPMKIWDFLLCGLPFIVSSEPSVSESIKKSGVAYFMKPRNQVPDKQSLKKFLTKKNLSMRAKAGLDLANRFDFEKQIKKRVQML